MSRHTWTRTALALTGMRRRLVAPLWRLAASRFARPLEVRGLDHLPAGAVVLAANHASHADTVVLLAALRGRDVLPAAAADYFFATRVLGAATVVGIGAFPFPREGRAGLDRAEQVLAAGRDVLLFPQGTRDGGPVRAGVGVLGAAGATVVPVHLDGPAGILPKGRRRPRRHPVTVTIGTPIPAGTDRDVVVARVAAHLGVDDGGIDLAAA